MSRFIASSDYMLTSFISSTVQTKKLLIVKFPPVFIPIILKSLGSYSQIPPPPPALKRVIVNEIVNIKLSILGVM
jgi:hypothetical protein